MSRHRALGGFGSAVLARAGLAVVAVWLGAAIAVAQPGPSDEAVPLRERRSWRGLDALRGKVDTRPIPATLTAVLELQRSQPGGAAAVAVRVDDRRLEGVKFPAEPGAASVTRATFALRGGGVLERDVAPLGPERQAAVGLTRTLHVARIEVNGGQGSAGGPFLATAVEVLDGTPAFAGAPEALREHRLSALRGLAPESMASFLDAAEARLLRRFPDLGVVDPRDLARLGRRDTVRERFTCSPRPRRRVGEVVPTSWERLTELSEVTWRTRERVFEVTVGRAVTRSLLGRELRRRDHPCPPCPCVGPGNCAPCIRCIPEWTTDCRGARLSAEEAFRATFDASGRLVKLVHFAPRTASEATVHSFEDGEAP